MVTYNSGSSMTNSIYLCILVGFTALLGVSASTEGLEKWAGTYSGKTRAGKVDEEWGATGTYQIQITNDGEFLIDDSKINGALFLSDFNLLMWGTGDGNGSEGQITFWRDSIAGNQDDNFIDDDDSFDDDLVGGDFDDDSAIPFLALNEGYFDDLSGYVGISFTGQIKLAGQTGPFLAYRGKSIYEAPSVSPSKSVAPTISPTSAPTKSPTLRPTANPTATATDFPTRNPSYSPTDAPSGIPSPNPTMRPSSSPSIFIPKDNLIGSATSSTTTSSIGSSTITMSVLISGAAVIVLGSVVTGRYYCKMRNLNRAGDSDDIDDDFEEISLDA